MQKTATKPADKKSTSNLTKNIVQFRSNFINLPNAGEDNRSLAMSVMSELMQFGYLPNQDAINNLSAASKKDIIDFHNEVINYLKKMTGSNRNYKAFWPNFPIDVMSKSEGELYLHQIVHYMSNGTYAPNEFTQERKVAFEQPKYYTITVGDEARFEKIFTDLVSVNQSLTPDDQEVIKFFVESGSVLRFPDQIPFKENLSKLFSLGVELDVRLTVTDVLRVVVGLSNGDVSLPPVPHKLIKMNRWSSHKSVNPAREAFKFKKFSRSERRRILGLLEKTNCDATEAVLKDQRWVRLGEVIHPGEYKVAYPKAFKMFDAIRNEKVQSFHGKVNSTFKVSFEEGLKVLSQRPGELFRKIDSLVRNNPDKLNVILSVLESVAPKVSNKVLFESYSHFQTRTNPNHNRTIMVKGSRKRTKLPDLEALSENTVSAIQEVILNSLKAKFSSLPKMGKIYLDEKLKDIPLPSNMRSASSALRPTVRGTRIPIGNADTKVVRAYIHWMDVHGNEDLDLSVTFVGMGKVDYLSWNGSHNTEFGCHSGDQRFHKGPTAEYADIILSKSLKMGFKYAIMDVRNFTGKPFSSVEDAVVGFMERQHAVANEIFVPATITNCMRLTNEASTTVVGIIDLETREFVFLDIDSSGIPVASANTNQLLDAIKPYLEAPKFSVYHLLKLHAEARGGELVTVTEKAEEYFSFEDFSLSYVKTLSYMGI